MEVVEVLFGSSVYFANQSKIHVVASEGFERNTFRKVQEVKKCGCEKEGVTRMLKGFYHIEYNNTLVRRKKISTIV